ncbi:hypothetical protein GOBAR_AA19079 [Gossypium barbadense]|uniref:Uncharacterized protein n=1 Tax=Gossypium barbadense TaxID=3634 RepID=A0A2P5XE22_GOSBA|nr:hypothetical protein GOBAR_AA19079 [Gossypium barbadense]
MVVRWWLLKGTPLAYEPLKQQSRTHLHKLINIKLLNSKLTFPVSNIVNIKMCEPKHYATQTPSEKDVKAPNIIERGKEEIEALFHHDKKPHHHKETHGRSDDIDENTAVDDVKGPNVFERVKEEVEAIVGAIHPKKESKGP